MNSFGVLGVELDVDRIDIGESLEQDRLALHHRFRRSAPRLPRPRIAVPLEITRDQIALGGIIISEARIRGDRAHRHGDARRISQTQVALRRHRLGGDDLDLARPACEWNCERFGFRYI